MGQTRPVLTVAPSFQLEPTELAQLPPALRERPGRTERAAQGDLKPAPEGAQRTQRLSLTDSIRIGLGRNFDIHVEQLNPRIRAQDIQREEAPFDPLVFAEGNANQTIRPTLSALARTTDSNVRDQMVRTGVRQRFKTGTSFEFSAEVDRSQNNAGFIQFNPAYTPMVNLTVTQNLLKNFGTAANTTAIRVARNNERTSASAFRDRVINVVSDIENLYWELVFSIQDLEVKKKSLALALDLLRRNKIQVEVGTMAPIEIVQAEASVASREADVITSEQLVRDNEDRLKRALNLPKDFTSWNIRINPTDEPRVIPQAPDVQRAFRSAVENRPDYAQAKLDIENKNIQVKFAENQLLPTLDLRASFGLNGLDDDLTSSVGDFNGDFRQWQVALTFEFPLRNRAAKSALTQRKIETAQSLLSLKNLEQQIFLEVREAVRNILTAQKRVEATTAARVLAERQLDAEEKKFAVGLSTSFQVLDFQEDLATAQSDETRSITDQIKALVTYRRVIAQTLRSHQIRLEDVGKGPNGR
ncbi:MAG: TolC family protein [Nitrospinota bacterium]